MDPDARAMPLWAADGVVREGELRLGQGGSEPTPNIASEWIRAARNAGVPGTDGDVAETVFYAICGVAASEDWIETQPAEHDDFPSVPIPADASELAASAETGREFSRLVDPLVDVEGVTRGTIRDSLRGLAEADLPADGDPVLEYGTATRLGGRSVDGSLLWGSTGGWRSLPAGINDFTLGGFNPIRKHLSYFVGKRLSFADRRRVTGMARRIGAIQELAQAADAHFAAAESAPLEPA